MRMKEMYVQARIGWKYIEFKILIRRVLVDIIDIESESDIDKPIMI
jgi:hypothetical protein